MTERRQAEEVLRFEFEERLRQLELSRDEEISRIAQARQSSVKDRPRIIATQAEQEAHAQWQKEEMARVQREYQEQLKDEKERTALMWTAFNEEWELRAKAEEEERHIRLKKRLIEHFDASDLNLLRNRYNDLESAYRQSQEEISNLKRQIEVMEARELTTHGRWIYRNCAIDSAHQLMQFLNTIRPSPRDIMGCVVMPHLHLWMRDRGTPTSVTYSLTCEKWNVTALSQLINCGCIVLLGGTHAGYVYYLQINTPVAPLSGAGAPELRALERFEPGSTAIHDISGAVFTEEDLQAEFRKFDPDDNGFIDAKDFVRFFQAMEIYGLAESDQEISRMMQKYNLADDGRLSFDEFSLLMLQLARR